MGYEWQLDVSDLFSCKELCLGAIPSSFRAYMVVLGIFNSSQNASNSWLLVRLRFLQK
jgi:hypothetical protein